MNNLSFNRWTLKFHNKDHEQIFEDFTDSVRLTVYKAITICLGIVGFVFLIQFLIQQQPQIIIILLSTNVIFFLIFYFLKKKVAPHLKYLNLLIYIGLVGGSCFIALSGFEIPLYLYGFSCSCISLPLIQYSHYTIKMPIIILSPIIQLIFFNAYNLSNLGFVVLTFLSSVLFAIQLYYNEYFLRLSFSFYQIAQRQIEILEEFVNAPLLAITFDERTQQFKPEFQNQEFQKEFQKLDDDYLREFLRMIKIENNSLNQSSEYPLRKSDKATQTLEELCFMLIKSNDQYRCSQQGTFHNQIKTPYLVNIKIKKVFLAQPILFILVEHNKMAELQPQNEQKIKYYKYLINNFAMQIVQQLEKINQKQMSQIQKSSVAIMLEQIQCIRLQILNKVQNFWVLINYRTIKSQQFKVQTTQLKQYLTYIENYFVIFGKNSGISFKIINFIDEKQHFTNSIEMLSQILINLYEVALKHSQESNQVILEVHKNDNLNPKYSQWDSIFDISEGQKVDDQFLIAFKISFFSKRDFELKPEKQVSLNPQNLEDFQYNQEKQFDLGWPISCFQLSRIGPYNEIETKKVCFQTEFEEQIYNYQMIFQVYSNYSQQDLSYVNYIKEQL